MSLISLLTTLIAALAPLFRRRKRALKDLREDIEAMQDDIDTMELRIDHIEADAASALDPDDGDMDTIKRRLSV